MKVLNPIFKLTCLASVIVTGCHKEHAVHEESIDYVVTEPLVKDTQYYKEYVCQIHSIQHIEVRALEKGYLTDIFVDEGQYIEKGEVMFQILPLIYQAELKRAQAEVDFAKIEFQNAKQLADKNVVSPNELALAQAKYDKAQAELSLAETHLSLTKVTAPFDGIMDRFHVRLGSLVDEGELLTSLSDNSQMWVYFNVPEAEYLEYKTNAQDNNNLEVELRLANQQVFDYPGIVKTIVADFNNETGNIAFRATFPNPDQLLRHGQTGNILIKVPLNQALLIPQKSTFEVLDKKYVYVVDEDHTVHSRHIKVSAELPHVYAVAEGLEEGEKILFEGLRHVRDGEEIEFESIEASEALANLDLYAE